MAPDKETGNEPAVEVHDDAENIKTGNEPTVENSTEKIEDQEVAEKKEIAETVAEIIERNVDEAVVAKEPVASVVEKKQEEPNSIEENKERDPTLSVEEPVIVLADEDATKKEAEIKEKSKDECVTETFVPLVIDESATDVEKDDEVSADNGKQGSMDNNGITHETVTTTTDPEKPTVDNVKGESKEEKTVDETKLTDSKEEDKTSPKQSITLIGKVKKSFMKAKKAITFTGKNNTNTKTPETKEDGKA